MSSEDDKNKNAAGFAGLSSLVSDVEIDADAPKSASAPPVSAKQEPPGEEQKSAPNAQQSGQPQPTAQTYQAPIQPSGNSGWKWVLGIGAVIAVVWMAGSGNKNQTSTSYPSSPSAPSYSPPAATPTAPSRLSEELPPVGTNNVLSGAQLRYCLAEDIRLESAKAAVNNYIDSHVDRFNGMVSDYNSRCGQFRYRKGALESARSEVERHRADLQAEGRGRFSTGTSAAAKSPTQVVKPTPDPIVKSIQQRLNALGYDAGTADGFMGGKTRVAIIAFQRDRGLTQDGAVNEALLQQLRSHSKEPSKVEAISGPKPLDTGPKIFTPPANSFVSGSNWYCKEGFRKIGERCEAITVPPNAFVSGSNWYCKEGFRKTGEQCEAIIVPANAFVSGSNWYCKEGFRKIGERCEAITVPPNAFVSGSNWYCKEGFRKTGDRCVSIFEK